MKLNRERFFIIFLSWLACCSSLGTAVHADEKSAEKSPDKPLKIGYIMVGSINDNGWNYNHNLGRLKLEKSLGSAVETTFMEKVPESAEAERAMERMIAQGNKIVFATSYGYLEPAMRVAARHPDVIFLETANRFSSSKAKNIGSYVMDYSAPMYVSGVVAARMSKSGNLGFVGAHPVPPLLVAINSFLLGAQSINPKVRVKVIWTNSWSDPATEAEATKSLAEQGADVIASNLDSSMPSSEAAERVHAYAVGTHADLSRKAPKAWLTGLRFDWGKLDIQLARSINERKWKPGTTFLDSTSDFSTLLPFGQSVPKPVQSEALRTLQLFRSGKLKVFVGPMKDRDGIERIPKGKVLGLEELQDLSWLAPGVEGSLPKQ